MSILRPRNHGALLKLATAGRVPRTKFWGFRNIAPFVVFELIILKFPKTVADFEDYSSNDSKAGFVLDGKLRGHSKPRLNGNESDNHAFWTILIVSIVLLFWTTMSLMGHELRTVFSSFRCHY